MVQLSHPYMTTRKNIALTRWTFAGKVMSLLFNMLSRLVVVKLKWASESPGRLAAKTDFYASPPRISDILDSGKGL